MKKTFYSFLLILLSVNLSFAQPANDNCVDADWLCYNQIISGNNTNATTENCLGTNINGCADDYPNFVGFNSSSSVWYKFRTNSAGGDVAVDLSNFNFNPAPAKGQALQAVIFEVPNPCEGQSYNLASAAQTNGTTDFTLNAAGLTANTVYYVLVNGSNTGAGVSEPADATFDITISGAGIITNTATAGISTDNTILCQGDISEITIDIQNCSDTVAMNWYYNNSFINDSTEFNTASLSDDGYLKLIIECGLECVYRDTTDSIFFEVTKIEVNAGEDFLIESGESVVLDGSGIGTPVWTPETGLSTTSNFTPTASPLETTVYFLTVTEGVCTKTDETEVRIKEIINIPSAFTPNDDAVNDTWEIEYISDFPDNVVTIYDRSGQVVFKTTGYKNVDNRWDGTYKNKPLPVSTYFYVIDLRTGDENSIFKGPVTIFK
jgi:gliding motility-associated-like protein